MREWLWSDFDKSPAASAFLRRSQVIHTQRATVPAAAVVGEAMVALVLASAYREKFGGDHVDDTLAALHAYRERIDWRR